MLNIDNNEGNNKMVNKMEKAFDASTTTIPQAKHPWANVKGPGSAVIATQQMIKWKAITFDRWTTDLGMEVELRVITPSTSAQ